MISQTISEEEAIKETIFKFVSSADANDAAKLQEVLDPNFRLVMNQLFGGSEVLIMNRLTYLEKIRSKEFGGDQREIKIGPMLFNGNSATVKVELAGSKMTFVSLLDLVKDKAGKLSQIHPLSHDIRMVERPASKRSLKY